MATPIEPVLLIGLGGTGREVLLRIRRRFFMSGYTTQPWISYLWVDTEAGQVKARMSPDLPLDYVARKTQFSENEICDIGVTQAQTQDVNDNKLRWMNIWEWADPAAVTPALDQDGLTNGAKQQPPLGRLALFISAGKIITALKDRMESLQHEKIQERMQALRDELRYEVSPNAACKVILVGSLAGGTGAGCCIDIAAMLKAAQREMIPELAKYNQLKSASRYGFFLLPDAFINDSRSGSWTNFKPERIRANGYAMLQEIENVSLRRSGSGQALTGREHAGQVHTTWMNTTNLNVPWIDGPMYNNVFLFDGYGEGGTRLTDVRDSYSLIANVLFYDVQGKNDAIKSAKSNEDYIQSRGHIETCPQEATSYANAIWSDVFSFSFAAAGSAQLTFDVPRLRLTAAYMLASRAVRRWLGESNTEPKEDAAKAEHRRNIELLKAGLLRRLDLELLRKTSPKEGAPWSETVKSRTLWDSLKETKALAWSQRVSGWRIGQRYTNLDQTTPRFDAKLLLEDLKKDYIGEGQRLPRLFLDLIDKRPTESFESGAQVYAHQGGVRALEWTVDQGGLLEQKLAEIAGKLKAIAETSRKNEGVLKQNASKISKEVDDELNKLDISEKDFLALPGAIGQLRERVSKQFKEAQIALDQYGSAKFETGLYDTMAQAWDMFRASADFKALLERWRDRAAQTRFFLEDILDRKREKDTELECGVEQILEDLRKSKWDHLTRVVCENLHSDENALWEELKKSAVRKNELGEGVFDDEFTMIQEGCLVEWRARLKRLADQGRLTEALPESFNNIVEFANFSAVPRQGSHREPGPDKLRLFDCLDALYELSVKPNCVSNLMRNSKINQFVQTRDLEFLEKYSICRLDLFRLSNGKIHRADNMFQNQGAVLQTPDEHRHLLAPAGFDPEGLLMKGSNPTRTDSNDPFEARLFRVEMGIPLPAVKVLKMGAAEAANMDPEKIHFFKPKSGYTPICRFDEQEATFLQRVYMHTMLGVILGQLRPGEKPENDDEPWYFEYRISSDGRPKSYRSWRSIADIIRHLQRREAEDLLQEIVEKNTALLRDMGPVSLTALYLIVRYNLRWIAPEKLTFAKITQQLKEQGIADQEWAPPTKGPQVLVLEALQRFIGEQMNYRWQKTLDVGGELQTTIRVLEHFPQHYARFVPVNLRASLGRRRGAESEVVELLCFNTEVDQSINVVESEDLLLRTASFAGRRNPVFERLGLRAPWATYTPGLAAQTYEHHRKITSTESTSMRPGDEDEAPNRLSDIAKEERLPGFWSAEMYMSDAPETDAQLYPQLLKSKTVVKQLDSMLGFMQRRMDLAAGKITAQVPLAGAVAPSATTTAPATTPLPPPFYVAFNGVASKLALEPAEMVRSIKSRELTAETKVWRKGMTDWMKAADVAELQSLLADFQTDDGPPPLNDDGPPPLNP